MLYHPHLLKQKFECRICTSHPIQIENRKDELEFFDADSTINDEHCTSALPTELIILAAFDCFVFSPKLEIIQCTVNLCCWQLDCFIPVGLRSFHPGSKIPLKPSTLFLSFLNSFSNTSPTGRCLSPNEVECSIPTREPSKPKSRWHSWKRPKRHFSRLLVGKKSRNIRQSVQADDANPSSLTKYRKRPSLTRLHTYILFMLRLSSALSFPFFFIQFIAPPPHRDINRHL